MIAASSANTPHGVVLLYDGECGFCNGAVQFVLRHERRHSLRFGALQGAYGAAVRAAHPQLADVDSVVLVDERDGSVLVRSAAAIEVGNYLGGIWRALATVARVVPRPIRDGIYDLIARNRFRLAGRLDACALLTPEQRARFVA